MFSCCSNDNTTKTVKNPTRDNQDEEKKVDNSNKEEPNVDKSHEAANLLERLVDNPTSESIKNEFKKFNHGTVSRAIKKAKDKVKIHGLKRDTWYNQGKNIKVQPLKYLTPKSAEEIVNILDRAIKRGLNVKPFGSGHSYSDIATTSDYLIDTSKLQRVNTHKDPISFCINKDELADNENMPEFINQKPEFVGYDPEKHVRLLEMENGIKIHNLNDFLNKWNLGLLNMGGYDGQSIVGVISTSTHGSGITLGPFSDMVKSLVLITTGEWKDSKILNKDYYKPPNKNVNIYRIESSSNPLTDPNKFKRTDIGLIQDDNCFNSCKVNMGTFGFIYSVVLEVMQEYWLKENRKIAHLHDIIQKLTPNENNTNHFPDILLNHRHYEVLVHPYPMKGDKVVNLVSKLEDNNNENEKDVEETKEEHIFDDDDNNKEFSKILINEKHYKHYLCLETIRNIHKRPKTKDHTRGHRNVLIQFLSSFNEDFVLSADIFNLLPHIIPSSITGAMKGLIDKSYINKSYKVFNLGLTGDAGVASEWAFPIIDNKTGKYTDKYIKQAIEIIHINSYCAMKYGKQYQTSPFSLRFVKKSSSYLSMMYNVDTLMIELDMVTNTYANNEIQYRQQNSLYQIGGIPHWGLEYNHLHGCHKMVEKMYPKFPEWKRVYDQLNSKGTFNNSFTYRMGFTEPDFNRN